MSSHSCQHTTVSANFFLSRFALICSPPIAQEIFLQCKSDGVTTLLNGFLLPQEKRTNSRAGPPACQPCRSGPCLAPQPQVLASPSLRALSRSLLSDPEAPALGSLRLVLSSEPFKKSASVPPERFKLSLGREPWQDVGMSSLQ